MEIRVYTSDGTEIGPPLTAPLTATMDSVYSDNTASQCVDYDDSTMCHNNYEPSGWLQIDLGSLYNVGTITVLNQHSLESAQIVGASISAFTGPDRSGTLVWQDSFEDDQIEYIFLTGPGFFMRCDISVLLFTPLLWCYLEPCVWAEAAGTFRSGYVGGVNTTYRLLDAQANCQELGPICKGVTCSGTAAKTILWLSKYRFIS